MRTPVANISLVGAAVLLLMCTNGQTQPSTATAPVLHASPEAVKWFREARFGMFIHWGVYSLLGRGEWVMNKEDIPISEYEKLPSQFNPTQFNAHDWVKLAKDAGAKYITITSKHHDGFCLFDSKLTDYDVMSTPFKRDIMKELSEACRKAGIKMCWYHSIMDWHHPDYLPRREWETRPAAGADFDRYVAHLRGQVEELLTGYGDIGVMWFDGEWESTWTHAYGKELYALCRRLQPNVIVNNRVDTGRSGMAGLSAGSDRAGDFGTPEQEIPKTGMPGVDWETCMTMNDHWGYNSHDDRWKSSTELIRMLVDIASKGGNFLLNVGPTAEGLLPPPAVERLDAMGRWLDVNGESIYGTAANPGLELAWGRCTMRETGSGTRLFLHVFEWPKNGTLVVPGLGNAIERAWLLASPKGSLEPRRRDSDLDIAVPAVAPDATCTVVVLDVRGRAIVYRPPTVEAAAEMFVNPIEVKLGSGSPTVDVRYTLDGSAPSASSPRYAGPLRVADTVVIKARCFDGDRAVSSITETRFTKVTPSKAASIQPQGGLVCEVFEGDWEKLPSFDGLAAVARAVVPALTLETGRREHVGRRYRGYVSVPRDDVYRFALTSDDG